MGNVTGKSVAPNKQLGIKMSLCLYDVIVFALSVFMLFALYRGQDAMSAQGVVQHSVTACICIFSVRYLGQIYRQIWRYGGIQCYIRLILADTAAFGLYFAAETILPIEQIALTRLLAFCCVNLLGSLAIRMFYRYAYKCGNMNTPLGKTLRLLLKICTGGRVVTEADPGSQKIKIAIIGAGTAGVSLAEDLWANPKAKYVTRCFIDNDPMKIGRDIHGIAVLSEDQATMETLRDHHIQEVVFAVPAMPQARRVELFEQYQQAGFRVKVYDYHSMETPGRKRQLREFNIEDLLMREQKNLIDEQTRAYYRDKVILITGGGGSIGSELCRQLAKMEPKQLIVVDVYENCAYDLQQELKIAYKGKLDIRIEIVSITNKNGLARVFREYGPDICINAAAHKHVPLREKNCVEAVENNVFGTLNVIRLCEEYGCERFIMVSTDKAVNPTNVMGATKRMCEMLVQAYSVKGAVKCSATRFGNVLDSAGSVIPIFKRQIAAGGPVTLTDKRIIRYFMTIPEASQLVLQSGAMAKNGELFVLDMGKPVKILELAENMIRLSGFEPYKEIDIVEIGLRPGEKLYEELLIKSEELDKTDSSMIFIERDKPLSMEEIEDKLAVLQKAVQTGEDEKVRAALHQVVATFKSPEEINARASKAAEMQHTREKIAAAG